MREIAGLKRLLQVFDWFLHAFGLAAMTTLAVIVTPNWPHYHSAAAGAPHHHSVAAAGAALVGLLGKIAPLSTPRHR